MHGFNKFAALVLSLLLLANCARQSSQISSGLEEGDDSGFTNFVPQLNNNGTTTNPGTNTNTTVNNPPSITKEEVVATVNALNAQDNAVTSLALKNLGELLQKLAEKIDTVWNNLQGRVSTLESQKLNARLAALEGLNLSGRLTAAEAGTKIPMYRCPHVGSLGGGAWGFYGCIGQIQSVPTCFNVEWPKQSHQQCTFIGNITVK